MNDDTPAFSPNDPETFRFVEAGMRLTYELESLGEIVASMGQTIQFCPVLSTRGWSNHKDFVASLRLKHLDGASHEIGRCLLDQDEVAAWTHFLRWTQGGDRCSGLRTTSLEYASRHGVRMIWQGGTFWNESLFFLHVSSEQAAILPAEFISQLLKIFDDFDSLCRPNG